MRLLHPHKSTYNPTFAETGDGAHLVGNEKVFIAVNLHYIPGRNNRKLTMFLLPATFDVISHHFFNDSRTNKK